MSEYITPQTPGTKLTSLKVIETQLKYGYFLFLTFSFFLSCIARKGHSHSILDRHEFIGSRF